MAVAARPSRAGSGQARLTPTQDVPGRRVHVVVHGCGVVAGMEGFAVVTEGRGVPRPGRAAGEDGLRRLRPGPPAHQRRRSRRHW